MTDKEIGIIMYNKAKEFINARYPQGWGGCAVMRTTDNQYLISIFLDSPNDSACLCMETGAMCEAQKLELKITHSLCMSRKTENDEPVILTACGICQERLRYWGDEVKVAVSNSENQIYFKALKKLMPFYWKNQLK